MILCEGKICKKRLNCNKYVLNSRNDTCQLIDYSTSSHGGTDITGKNIIESYYCGNLSNNFPYYEPCNSDIPSNPYDVKIYAPIQLIEKIPDFQGPLNYDNIGNFSDGYHTFNELYHHRAILFSVICNQNKEIAWKSKFHHDGSMYDDMFIVGINTPQGPATYHYHIDPYWDYFDVTELPNAPEWDGHTPDDALKRLRSLY